MFQPVVQVTKMHQLPNLMMPHHNAEMDKFFSLLWKLVVSHIHVWRIAVARDIPWR